MGAHQVSRAQKETNSLLKEMGQTLEEFRGLLLNHKFKVYILDIVFLQFKSQINIAKHLKGTITSWNWVYNYFVTIIIPIIIALLIFKIKYF